MFNILRFNWSIHIHIHMLEEYIIYYLKYYFPNRSGIFYSDMLKFRFYFRAIGFRAGDWQKHYILNRKLGKTQNDSAPAASLVGVIS